MNPHKIAVFAALILLASGCIYNPQENTTKTENPTQKQTPSGEPQTTAASAKTTTTVKSTATTSKDSGGIISDLAAALSNNIGYRCTFKQQDITSEGWVRGDRYYIKSTTPDGSVYALSDGTWMYSWQEGQRNGVKYNIEEIKEIAGDMSGPKDTGYQDLHEVSAYATNVVCVPDVSADSRFKPPADVEFQDMGEVLKQIKNMGMDIQAPYEGNLPMGR